jgi:DNA-binding CsgD family transcriptional regulator
VLHLIGSGHSSQEIARLLSRSIKTIETHRANIRAKLHLKDGADLMRYATHWITAEH